jgi:hypothetical protein
MRRSPLPQAQARGLPFGAGLGVHVAVEFGMQPADRFDLCG